MTNSTNYTSEQMQRQLENEKYKYKQAFEEDKPFFFLKIIQLRIRRLEHQLKTAFKNK